MWLVGSRDSSVAVALLHMRRMPITLRIGVGASEGVAAPAAVATQTVFLTDGRRVCRPRRQTRQTRGSRSGRGVAQRIAIQQFLRIGALITVQLKCDLWAQTPLCLGAPLRVCPGLRRGP